MRPLGSAHGGPAAARGGGGGGGGGGGAPGGPPARRPAADGWCAQEYGGAVYMASGIVTFQGGSSITGTRAVRCAQTHGRECMHTQT